ncbi:MAG: hypothetical protein M3506_00885 [Chloroflexota bacterium]|nr:hypothetical protein [Chloroflexota bacterium]
MGTQNHLPATRLRGRTLGIARGAWAVIALATLALFLVAVATRYDHPAPTGDVRAGMLRLGLSFGAYAVYNAALGVALAVGCFAVAVVLFWRRSNDPMALFVSMTLITFGASPTLYALADVRFLAIPVLLIGSVGWTSIGVFFYVFPDGRFVPQWTRWLVLVWLLMQIPWNLSYRSAMYPANWHPLLFAPVEASLWGSALFAQFYRYRYVATSHARQQMKWVVSGLTVVVAIVLPVNLLDILAPDRIAPGSGWEVAAVTLNFIGLLLMPLAMGIAVLRYRLYDIDLLINRALVYGILSALLVGVYLGSVLVLQRLMQVGTGEESQLAIVLSTLTSAALFGPLERHTQALIDRHFYRRRYDAARTLAAYSATLRDEVDLSRLSDDLIGVVQETMQPEHVTLWLRPVERG